MTVCRIAGWVYFIAAGEALMARWFGIAALMFFLGLVFDIFSRFESPRRCIVEFLRWSTAQAVPVKILVIVVLALPVGFMVEYSRGFATWWDGICAEAFD